MDVVLELKGITKRFPGVVANDRVDLDLRRGEIHAVLGENGAGKSTIMKIVSGLYSPDEGTILLEGRPVRFAGPREAITAGIGMVHQHFMLIPVMTVAENIVLGREPARGLALDVRRAREDVRQLSARYGLEIDPDRLVGELSVGLQQRVEILKAFYRGANILILDEPTAMLTPQEARELFRIMRELARSGVSIFFISHKLDEVMEVADRVSVMRQGRRVATLPAAETSPEQLAELMVGRSVLLRVERGEHRPGEPVLAVEGLGRAARGGRAALADISFEVRAGEIFGLAGVEGNGQQELVEVLAGLLKPDRGTVRLGGVDVTGRSPRQLFEMGVAYIPPDRQAEGLVLDLTVAENLALKDYYRAPLARRGLIDVKRLAERARALVVEYDVRPANPAAVARTLSGGNQQKVILGREVSSSPRLLIAAQPTRGLDVGAIEFVHRRLLALRDSGAAVLLSSLELDEILSLADRIGVMYKGRLVAVLDADEATRERVGLLMTGATAAAPAGAGTAAAGAGAEEVRRP
ncbi:MAG: ABC transporter ATP-binding protein [Firmicutes bacterium]|nr:ABC transporter ATP-binding protein [Bacillota bacterium]